MLWQYCDGNPLTGAWNARVYEKSRFLTNSFIHKFKNKSKYIQNKMIQIHAQVYGIYRVISITTYV